MRPVIEQDPSRAFGRESPPRLRARVAAGVSGRPIDRELSEVPPADRIPANPVQHLTPRRIVPVLVAGHHDAACVARGDREPGGLVPRECDRFLAEHMIAVREGPERRLEMRRGRRADIHEIQGADRREGGAVRHHRDVRTGQCSGRGIDGGDDAGAGSQCGVVPEARQVGVPCDPAEPDQRAAIGVGTRRDRARPPISFRQWGPLAVSVGWGEPVVRRRSRRGGSLRRGAPARRRWPP